MDAIYSNLLDANPALRLSLSASENRSSQTCTRGPCRTPHQSLVTWGQSKERARSHVIRLDHEP